MKYCIYVKFSRTERGKVIHMNLSNMSMKEFLTMFSELGKQKSIKIWGGGTYGNIIGVLLNESGISWSGYIDNNKLLYNKKLNGKVINSFCSSKDYENCSFIISTIFYHDILLQLQASGINEENIYWFENTKLLDEMACYNIDPSPYICKMKQFENIHENERCFIIGNGPSLLIDDLNTIKNEYSMAANKIFQLYGKTDWRPSYYFSDDPYVIQSAFPSKDSYKSVIKDSKAAFTSTRRKMFDYRNDTDINNMFFYRTCNDLEKGKPGFSNDCSRCVFTSYTITYTMLQIAVYMGFKEIFLLGIDHNYSVEKNINGEIIRNSMVKNHTEYMDDNDFDIEHIPEIGIMNLGYEVAKGYAKNCGVEIYNATRGGKLEVFERVDFDAVCR